MCVVRVVCCVARARAAGTGLEVLDDKGRVFVDAADEGERLAVPGQNGASSLRRVTQGVGDEHAGL